MIPQYPIFSKLNIKNRDEIIELNSKYPPYSDFNFTSIYCWDTDETAEVSMLNNNLVIKLPGYLTGNKIVSILGNINIDASIKILLKDYPKLELVPQIIIDNISEFNDLKITEDRDNFDYIVNASDLAELSFHNFPKKRKMLDKFTANFPNIQSQIINLNDSEMIDRIISLFKLWSQNHGKSETESNSELIALKRLINNHGSFKESYALGLFDNKQLVGFNTFEIIDQEFGISSFQKGDANYDYIYVKITNELAKFLSPKCKLINFEQDLGFVGLRNSKLSYHPVEFLKKYIISTI